MGNSVETLGKLERDPVSHPAESSTAQGGYAGPTTGTERILAEVLADVAGLERVPVDSNFFNDLGADSLTMAQFCARVRKRADLPSVSMKDIYQHPTINSLATALADSSLPPVEKGFAEALADIVGVERVPVDSNFFDDLGADSLVMAQFCARVRKRADLPSVSMKDLYQHPTISSLATALAGASPTSVQSSVPAPIEVATPASTRQYVLCGTLQLLSFLGYAYLAALVTVRGYEYISASSSPIEIYLRSVVFGGVTFLGTCLLPILAKWIIIGRWKPQQIRIWSLAYVRFWVVKTLIRANPLVLLFPGSPLYVLYLRALGAKIGPGVTILSRQVPVCTDLLTIGDGTIVYKGAIITGYRAHAGLIQTGAVTLGKDVVVCEAAVIDIGTSMGDGAQLGHRSSLHVGQAVPDGERWHGSPAQRTDVDYRAVIAHGDHSGTPKRAVYSVLQLLAALLLSVPLAIGGVAIVLAGFPQLTAFVGPETTLAPTSWTFYLDALEASAVIFFGLALLRLLLVITVPRVLNLAITPDRVYPLYGFHYWVHRTIARTTNSKFLTSLFGDSSYIVPYLRALGYDLSRVVQTGSNFGTGVQQENPYLSSVGSATMVADGLSIINADFSSTSFRVSKVSIGPRNFLGNGIAYPSQAKVGDNCLLATKVAVPIDGKIREGVGLLGSPSFQIPRSVERDASFDSMKTPQELAAHLAAKNRYNMRTMGLVLLVRWMNLFGILLIAMAGGDLYDRIGVPGVVATEVLILVFTLAYGILVERANMRFRPLRPQFCSIYDPYFWWHERLWKLLSYQTVFNGTPFKGMMWRLLGVRIGRRVFDDGCDIPERTLVTIGDDCTLNAASWIQCHSQEDGTFKSDHVTIGDRCTLGIDAWVHYGVTMGDGAVLALDSFLMKGEQMPPQARWGGNPAREMGDHSAAEAATASAPTWSSKGHAVTSSNGGMTRWER